VRYCEGRTDLVFQRIMDAVQAIPGLVLRWPSSRCSRQYHQRDARDRDGDHPGNSRIVRGAVLAAKQNRYVEAGRRSAAAIRESS